MQDTLHLLCLSIYRDASLDNFVPQSGETGRDKERRGMRGGGGGGELDEVRQATFFHSSFHFRVSLVHGLCGFQLWPARDT